MTGKDVKLVFDLGGDYESDEYNLKVPRATLLSKWKVKGEVDR